MFKSVMVSIDRTCFRSLLGAARIWRASLAILVLIVSSVPVARADGDVDFKIDIIRDVKNSKATLGQMGINGQSLCYTLEPPAGGGPEGKGPIPNGTYSGHLRYDKKDHWRVQLDNVPGFSGIQIHIGNSGDDTAGCILVGTGRDTDAGTLSGSADAYQLLRRAFYGSDDPNSTPDKSITVAVSDK